MRGKGKSLLLAAALSVMPLTSTGAAAAPVQAEPQAPHTVTYDEYSVQIDGEPLYIWSAEFHYFRLPSPDAWRDVLQKVKAAGFNAVSLYFAWGYHSPAPGVYDFTGIRDVERLLTMAEETGLYVIARPGPYINAEISGGGMPAWRKTAGRREPHLRAGVHERGPGVDEPDQPDHRAAPAHARHGQRDPLPDRERVPGRSRRTPTTCRLSRTGRAQDGIDVPTFVNDGGANGNWVSGKGAPDIYGFDAYPQGFDCKDPDIWRNLPDYSCVKSGSPSRR